MRARNPHQRIFHIFMPQSIVSYNDEETFWHADTSWSLDRLCQFYAQQNDWYLYDIFGGRIQQWGCWVANWTPYCPLGVYGTSKGMTYAQWYIEVALPQIAFHSLDAWGEPWGWGSSAYDGIAWETLYECPACCEADQFRYADPDRDGEPEGIEGTCFDGGDDTLRRLYREVNDDFFARLQSALPSDFVINTNRGGVSLNPTWAWEMNGLKLEDWNPSRTNPARSWWSWMYGRRGYGGTFIGDGYEFAERVMHRSGIDELDGWDVSWLMLWTRGAEWPPAYKARMQRFGLGTTMLGDGYFIFTKDQHYPTWFGALDWDFGAPLEGFQKETATGDTLYVRRFEKGVVEVNPYPHTVQGVAVEDARFSFWLTISDLMVDDAGADHVMLRWVVPSSQVNGIQSTEIRYAEFPITPENWNMATPAPSGPVSGSPGETIRYSVRELPPETTFYFAAKNTVRGRLEPLISNVVSAVTGPAAPPPPPEEDTTPPAAIMDLASVSRGQSWIDLRWTAPGDDGMSGTAQAYELRYRVGAEIEDEGDWNAASPAGGLPEPAAAGSIQQFRLSGLQPGTGYGVALRASDEAGNVAGLSNPLAVATLPAPPPPPPPPPEEDPLPPAPVGDLALLDSGDTWALLGWSCPGGDGENGRADHFVLGLLAGLAIDSEERWAAADTSAEGLPDPGEPGEPVTYLLAGLAPGAVYGVAVRAGDEAGRRSALGNGLLVETSVPPDTIPPAAIADLRSPAQGPNWIELLWTAPGDDGDEGAAARYLLRLSAGGAIADEEGWAAADSAASPPEPAAAGEAQGFRLEGLAPATLYGIALRAEDGAGNLSPLGPAFTAVTTAAADTIAPAAIEDLAVAVVTADGFDLVWTAPGGDGAEGTAAEYILGRRAGAAIADAAGWAAAERETLVAPLPLPAGTPQGCSLRGLASDTIYGLAVRAVDEAGNVAPLPATPLVGRTLAARDTIPPAAVTDLALLDVGESWLDLFWSAPGGDGMEGRATSFALAWSDGTQPIDTEERWQAARIQTAGLPAPPEPGMPVSWRLSGLAPASDYAVAVRAYDEQGLAGGLSNPLVARTLSPPPPPPPPPPDEPAAPASIEDLVLAALGPDWAELRWSCPGGDGPRGAKPSASFSAGGPAPRWRGRRTGAPPTRPPRGYPIPGLRGAPSSTAWRGLRSRR